MSILTRSGRGMDDPVHSHEPIGYRTRQGRALTVGWVAIIAAITLTVISSCSMLEGRRPRTDLVTFGDTADGFVISPPGTGQCRFDFRSRVLALDIADGSSSWSRDIPWSPLGAVTPGEELIFAAGIPINDESYSVSALRQSDGTPVWQHFLGHDQGPLGQPLVVGPVVVTTSGGKMIALDTSTGVVRWTSEVAEGAGLAAHRDAVLAMGDDELISVDAATGEMNWAVHGYESIAAGPVTITDPGVVLVVDQARGLLGIDAETGDVRWLYQPPDGAWLSSDVSVSGNVAVVTDGSDDDGDGNITTVDVTTGSPLWHQPIVGWTERLLTGRDIVIEADDQLVLGRSMFDGAELWRFTASRINSVSMPEDGLVVVQDRGSDRDPDGSVRSTVHLLDAATGEELWSIGLDALGISDATIVDDHVVIGLSGEEGPTGLSRNGAVMALNRTNGSVLWRTDVRDAVNAAPYMVDGRVIVTSTDEPFFCDCPPPEGQTSSGVKTTTAEEWLPIPGRSS